MLFILLYLLFSDVSNYYHPGTTLFSTINSHGKIGDFTSQLPQPTTQGSASVPVIILRILPAQLASTHLYPNLPQSNAFAPVVNQLDIKSLLTSFLAKMNAPPVYTGPTYQQEASYLQQNYQAEPQYYNQPNQIYQQPQYDDQGGYENYQGHIPTTQIIKSHSYEPQTIKTSFDIVKSVEPQPYTYNPQNQYQPPQYVPQKSHSQGLLTHENYPSKSHTRVIFKTPDGK